MKNKIIKILLLEDDPTAGRQVELLLRQHQYEITIVHSSKTAILLSTDLKPDLILCNAQLRSGSSHQFLIEMRSIRRLKHIPFIFIHGKTELKHARFSMNLGADDYLITPLNGQDLLMSIKARLNRFEEITALSKQMTMETLEIPVDVAEKLSKTEFKIYRMVAGGLTAREIAIEMSISMKTVENHRYNIARKLNISGHYALLHYVIKNQGKEK